ncbi:hypothetical protein CGJ90_24260, partial [Vibrio parahaemolyticus]|uniref:hypothetical protein n=2 Tax=Vibrionaceae TaxID=641 RepID=UPI001175693F
LIPSWPIYDLKKHIIYGDANKLWEVKVNKGKVLISKTKFTNEMYVNIVENKIFNDAVSKIRNLCKTPVSKIDRQRLV